MLYLLDISYCVAESHSQILQEHLYMITKMSMNSFKLLLSSYSARDGSVVHELVQLNESSNWMNWNSSQLKLTSSFVYSMNYRGMNSSTDELMSWWLLWCSSSSWTLSFVAYSWNFGVLFFFGFIHKKKYRFRP